MSQRSEGFEVEKLAPDLYSITHRVNELVSGAELAAIYEDMVATVARLESQRGEIPMMVAGRAAELKLTEEQQKQLTERFTAEVVYKLGLMRERVAAAEPYVKAMI